MTTRLIAAFLLSLCANAQGPKIPMAPGSGAQGPAGPAGRDASGYRFTMDGVDTITIAQATHGMDVVTGVVCSDSTGIERTLAPKVDPTTKALTVTAPVVVTGYTCRAFGSTARQRVRTVAGTTDTLLAADDNNVVVYTSGSAVTVTVPSGLGLGYSALLIQSGAGAVTIQGGAGVTLTSGTTSKAKGIVTLIAEAADSILLAGDLQ